MTSIPQLRDYQTKAVSEARTLYGQGIERLLLVAPTGAGKTTMFSYVVASAYTKGKKCCVIAHRTELIDQASARLDLYGIPHGVIQAKHPRTDPFELVQVASIDTLRNRPMWWKHFDFIVVDEAHRTVAPTYVNFIDSHKGLGKVMGVTATPFRTDGKGLGDIYQAIVQGPSVQELIGLGFLVPPRMFAPSVPDLDGLKISRGDFEQGALAERADQADLVGDIVTNWQKAAYGRPTVAFAVNVAHSIHIAETFRAAGVRAAHLDGETHPNDRKQIIADLGSGHLQVVSNVGVLTEGTDIPSIGAIILARPTKSLGLYIQMVGRGLRPAERKTDCVVLDHGGCCLMHGPVTEPVQADLEGLKKRKDVAERWTTCMGCYAIISKFVRRCPMCGHSHAPEADGQGEIREIKQRDGELVEVDFEAAKRERMREQKHAETYEELVELAKRRGYKPGWARHIWKSRQRKQRAHG